ncbi:dTMP kinase [Pseudobacteriovorax antillogorgiicola]|uniref:dTMP kinase n=1 Tax=Pseudobacteriovorax antillogorgiicola TaxID=1513793 RepID=UPI0014055485|nr:dTMP kinase [Pseudobacteriovorax antillogorgiicola]
MTLAKCVVNLQSGHLLGKICTSEVALAVEHGKFITVEGGEGVGKTVFTKGLSSRIKSAGLGLVQTREPGGTPVAQQIRQIFMSPPPDDSLAIKTELFLVSAARCQHLEKLIRPNLEQGSWVLCDRFHDSTRVYQGIGGGVPQAELETLITLSVGQSDPDLTFILDCDVKVALDRVNQRSSSDESGNRYDEASVDFHETLRNGFLDVARRFPKRVVVLDASQDPDTVIDQAIKEINMRFGTSV